MCPPGGQTLFCTSSSVESLICVRGIVVVAVWRGNTVAFSCLSDSDSVDLIVYVLYMLSLYFVFSVVFDSSYLDVYYVRLLNALFAKSCTP